MLRQLLRLLRWRRKKNSTTRYSRLVGINENPTCPNLMPTARENIKNINLEIHKLEAEYKMLSADSRRSVEVLTNIQCIDSRGPFDCSNATRDLGEFFEFNAQCIEKSNWRQCVLSGYNLLGGHNAHVSAVIFKEPQPFISIRDRSCKDVKCIVKCENPTLKLAYREFEDLFQVKNWSEADGLMIAFYDSRNLFFT